MLCRGRTPCLGGGGGTDPTGVFPPCFPLSPPITTTTSSNPASRTHRSFGEKREKKLILRPGGCWQRAAGAGTAGGAAPSRPPGAAPAAARPLQPLAPPGGFGIGCSPPPNPPFLGFGFPPATGILKPRGPALDKGWDERDAVKTQILPPLAPQGPPAPSPALCSPLVASFSSSFSCFRSRIPSSSLPQGSCSPP